MTGHLYTTMAVVVVVAVLAVLPVAGSPCGTLYQAGGVVYVVPGGSSDETTRLDATVAAPRSLAAALSIASTCASPSNRIVLRLANATFTTTATVVFPGYTTVDGGYHVPNPLPTVETANATSGWSKVIGPHNGQGSRTTIHRTLPVSPSPPGPLLLTATSVGSTGLILSDLVLSTDPGPAPVSEADVATSTMGLVLDGCVQFALIRVDIAPGAASPGADGEAGVAGAKGAKGANGVGQGPAPPGGAGGGGAGAGSNGGGAAGSAYVNFHGGTGGKSADPRAGGGGGGGSAGSKSGEADGGYGGYGGAGAARGVRGVRQAWKVNGAGGHGGSGAAGAHGNNAAGTPTPAYIDAATGLWVLGDISVVTPATDGQGGGGGGGGASGWYRTADRSPGSSGGSGGGEGGTAAKMGRAGGCSTALTVLGSAANEVGTGHTVRLKAGTAGPGGAYAVGGAGGAGGDLPNLLTWAFRGGAGGAGGKGGDSMPGPNGAALNLYINPSGPGGNITLEPENTGYGPWAWNFDDPSLPVLSLQTPWPCVTSLLTLVKSSVGHGWVFPEDGTVFVPFTNSTTAQVALVQPGTLSLSLGSLAFPSVFSSYQLPTSTLLFNGVRVSDPVPGSGDASRLIVPSQSVLPTISATIPSDMSGPLTWYFTGTSGCVSETGASSAAGSSVSVNMPGPGVCVLRVVAASSTSCGPQVSTLSLVSASVDLATASATPTPVALVITADDLWTFHLSTFSLHGLSLASVDDQVGLVEAGTGVARSSTFLQPSIGVFTGTAPFRAVGTHLVNITFNGDVVDSVGTFGVTVVAGVPRGSTSVVQGDGISSPTRHVLNTFTVDVKDAWGNNVIAGGLASLTGAINPDPTVSSSQNNEPLDLTCRDLMDGTFTCQYVGSGGGRYVAQLALNGESVQGSPFILSIPVVCPVGTFAASVHGPCEACEVNSFNDDYTKPCTACPLNTNAAAYASVITNCTCNVGTWATQSGVACVPCPGGARCDGGKAFPQALSGFFQDDPSDPGSFSSCRVTEACLGDGVCASEYTGYACKDCASKHYRDATGLCQACPSGLAGTLSMFLSGITAFTVVTVAAALVTLFSLRSSVTSKARKTGGGNSSEDGNVGGRASSESTTATRSKKIPHTLSTILVVLQVIGLLGKASTWPESARTVMGSASVANLDFSVLASGCVMDDFFLRYAVALITPVYLLGIVGLVAIVFTVVKATLLSSRSRFQAVSGVDLVQRIVLVAGPLLYIPLSKTVLELFDCSKLPDGQWYLDAEASVVCFSSSTWLSCLPLGLVGLVVYVAAIPAGTVWVLHKHANELYSSKVYAKYGPLYALFRTPYYWYTCVLLIKRLCIVCAALFFSPSLDEFLIFSLLAIFAGFGYVQLRWKPYFEPVYNSIETCMNFGLIGLVAAGAVFWADSFSSSASKAVFVVIVLAILGGIFLSLAYFLFVEVFAISAASSSASFMASTVHAISVYAVDVPDPEVRANLLRLRDDILEAEDTAAAVTTTMALMASASSDGSVIQDSIPLPLHAFSSSEISSASASDSDHSPRSQPSSSLPSSLMSKRRARRVSTSNHSGRRRR